MFDECSNRNLSMSGAICDGLGPEQIDGLLRKWQGHTGAVVGVAFSPDGDTLASASADHTIVLRNTQARAELPARSRRTISASRIEPHHAGVAALQAVEHTDPDAVLGRPVRGGAAGYPDARLQVVGELPVAGAFVADPRRLDWLCCDGRCRGHGGLLRSLAGQTVRRTCAVSRSWNDLAYRILSRTPAGIDARVTNSKTASVGQLYGVAMAAVEQPIWPLTGLEVVTPMLTLRYITDDLGVELALLAAEGVHDPATMPFSTPWTDVPSPELERNTLRFYWRNRADTTVGHWDPNLAVVVDGVAVGKCSIEADAFPTRRSAETGSWVGRRYQRRGIGREVRHAALHLIFAGFDADQATTRAWQDNTASLEVTGSLPYVQTGSWLQQRRERPDTMLEFAMSRAQWNTARREDIELIGIDAARAQLTTARDVPSSDG